MTSRCLPPATAATSWTSTATGATRPSCATWTHRHDFHVAVENWGHDFNIGSVIRTANAFNAKAFHIVGKRRWNRRGAMVTDRYQHEYHHPSVEDLIELGGRGTSRRWGARHTDHRH